MALLSHLLAARAKTSSDNSGGFVCVFSRLFIFGQALVQRLTDFSPIIRNSLCLKSHMY